MSLYIRANFQTEGWFRDPSLIVRTVSVDVKQHWAIIEQNVVVPNNYVSATSGNIKPHSHRTEGGLFVICSATAQLSVSPGRDIVSMCYGWLPLELLPQTCSASFQDVFSMPRAYFVVSPWAVRSLKLKCCFTSTETVGLLGTGAQDVHLDLHTAPELWVRSLLVNARICMLLMMWSLMSSDIWLTY